MAFYSVEPFGLEVDDAFQAHVCQTMVDLQVPRGKKRPTLDQFMLFSAKPQKKQTPEEMYARMKMTTAWIASNQRT